MPRITPVHWRSLVRVFEACGFAEERTSGSHIVMTREGVARPIVIPKHRTVAVAIIRNNIRTAGLSRKRYFELLDS